MSRLYSQAVLDYYLNSAFIGEWPQNDASIITVTAGSESAGELMQLQVKHHSINIVDIRFKVYGCGYAIAGCAWLCDCLSGQSLPLKHISYGQLLIEQLDLPQHKYHCALCIDQLVEALRSVLTSSVTQGVT